MVIGTGMIATEFKSYQADDNFVIFASGVSDSTHAREDAFERESKLLNEIIEQHKDKVLVYFSTCSIYDISMKNSAYVNHKLKMEEMIIRRHSSYLIFRLSNVVGKTNNQHTVVNFFIRNILAKQPFEVWQLASRNIIDIDDMYRACDEILQNKLYTNTILNIANPHNYNVLFIIETIETHFKTKGNQILVPKGSGPIIDTSIVEQIFRKFSINFGPDYFSKLLQKYFPA